MEGIYARFKNQISIFFEKKSSSLNDPKNIEKSDKKVPFFKPSPEAKSPVPSAPAYFTMLFTHKFQKASESGGGGGFVAVKSRGCNS